MKSTVTAATIATAALLLAGCGSSTTVEPATISTPSTVAVKGDVTLSASDIYWSNGNICSGQGGYDDLEGGAQVLITDDADKTLAVGALEQGSDPDFNASTYDGNGYISTTCKFPFTVTDVPATSKFYKIKVTHRDGPTYTLQQLKAGPHLTIGN